MLRKVLLLKILKVYIIFFIFIYIINLGETIKIEENINSSSFLDVSSKSTKTLPRKVGSIINELDYITTEVELEKNHNDDGEIVSDSEINIKNEVKDDIEKKNNRKRQLDNTDDNDEESNNKKSALEHLRSMKFAKRDPFGDSSYVFYYYRMTKNVFITY